MKNYTRNTEETLITFHIGRGGRFYNAGYKSYRDQDTTINTYCDDLFLSYENEFDILNNYKKYPNIHTLIQECLSDHNFERLARVGLSEDDFGQQEWFYMGGSPVGLAGDNDGTGCINIDNDYDTTIVVFLKDCDENELRLILNSSSYKSTDVEEYCKEALGIEEEVEDEE